MDVTTADVLSNIKGQLEWSGPNGKVLGHVVLPRDKAEFLHQRVLGLIFTQDQLVALADQFYKHMRKAIEQLQGEPACAPLVAELQAMLPEQKHDAA